MRRKILIAFAIGAGTVFAVVILALLYLNFADLGRYRGTVESLLTDAIGRKVRIAGDFEVDFGFDPRIKATEITLANPNWSTEPSMISVDSLEFEVNLRSLLSGPIRIHRLAIAGANVELEEAADGRTNWVFDAAPAEPAKPSTPIRLSVGAVELQDAHLDYRGPALDKPLHLGLRSLRMKSDAADMLDLDLTGDLNGTDLDVAGRFGTLAGLLAAEELEVDLGAHLGNVTLSSSGTIGDLATFADADMEIHIDGPTMSEVTDLLGLPSLGEGPFHIAARAHPSEAGSNIDLDGALGQVTVTAAGTTDALLAPTFLDVEVHTAGPSLAAVAALAGIEGARAQPFSANGHLRWEGFPITFDNVELASGDNRVALNGTLGAPPMMLGTDFHLDANGPDLSAFAVLGRFDLPAESFRVTGRLVRLEEGVGIENLEATVGRTVFRVDGSLGDPPAYAGTDLHLEAKGPDLAAFSGLAGIDLPALPFEVGGRLVPDGDSIRLDSVSARLGANTAHIQGTVMAVAGFEGTNLQLDLAGPDLSWLEPITGFEELPTKPYRLAGTLRMESGGFRLGGVEGRIGEVTARMDGRIGLPPGFAGTDVKLVAQGPDVSIPASLAGIPNMAADSFRIEGGLKRVKDGIDLDDVQAQVGAAHATVSGHIVPIEGFTGTTIRFDLEGPNISTFGPIVGQPDLPDLPFSAQGSLGIDGTGYRLERATATLGKAVVEITGTIGASEGLEGTDVDFSIDGPSLARVGSAITASDLADLPVLPEEPFSIAGGLAINESGYVLRDLHLTLANATVDINGLVGPLPGLVGTDLTIDSDGPNASLFTAVTGVSVPVAPFRINGRVERPDEGIRFHGVRVQLGEYRATANGFLGEPPKLIGTEIDIEANGPSLLLISELAKISALPDLPFSVAGSFNGNPGRFKTKQLTATLGSSDLTASFRLDVEDRPELTGTFYSNRLDLAQMFPVSEPAVDQPETPETPSSRGGFVFSDTPFDLGILGAADGEISVSIDELVMPHNSLSDIQATAKLRNGRLEVDPVSGSGRYGGVLHGVLLLEPVGNAYRLATDYTLEQARIDLSTSHDDPSAWPVFDFAIKIDTAGGSLHELAAAANGRIKVIAGEGVIEKSLVNILSADVLVKILEILNPFTRENPASMLNCAVMVVDIVDGVATVDPLAVQTDTLTVLADGRIDFSTEKMSLDWITKPRKGLGVSASLLTNPYIRVGGTLSKPAIEMKPIEAAASTGLAVATGGLSILGQGLLDRITSEQKVCEQALKKAARQQEKKEKKAARDGG